MVKLIDHHLMICPLEKTGFIDDLCKEVEVMYLSCHNRCVPNNNNRNLK